MTAARVSLVGSDALLFADVIALYDAVGWSAYTDQPETLRRALAGSASLAAAHAGGILVGLARCISDGATICYLQDILVHPDYQRSGIGRRLALAALGGVPDVRQTVLLTDARAGQRAFYSSLGFTEAHDVRPAPLRAFVRIRP